MRLITLPSVALLSSVLTSSACSINVDNHGHIVREQKQYVVEGVVDLNLTTFDGAIEVRGWDRNEVTVEIEKRAQDKDATEKIQVIAEQKGSTITIDVRSSGGSTYIGIGAFTSPSARLIVNAPHKVNVNARSGDGSIVVDRIEGRLELKTSDGTVRATETAGELIVESGDGSIQIEDVVGRVEARTDDGTVRIYGTPSAVRARSGDGSIVLRIRGGAVMTDDWVVTTTDGSIVAELPDGFNAMIDAEPGSGDRARSDLELIDAVGGTREQRTLRGKIGAGGKTLTLRSGDGSIRLTNY
jgi:Putative adhesin